MKTSRHTQMAYDITKIIQQYPEGSHTMIIDAAKRARRIAKEEKEGNAVGAAVDALMEIQSEINNA